MYSLQKAGKAGLELASKQIKKLSKNGTKLMIK
jgi:hypothetical protein